MSRGDYGGSAESRGGASDDEGTSCTEAMLMTRRRRRRPRRLRLQTLKLLGIVAISADGAAADTPFSSGRQSGRRAAAGESAHEALFRMCSEADAEGIAQGVAQNDFTLDLTDHRGRGVMHYAVSGSSRGKLAFLRWLCLFGFENDINSGDRDGVTPVHVAAESGSVKVLVASRHGARMDVEDDDGCTALFAAASCDKVKAMEWLVEKCRLDVSATDDGGYTCLHEAIANGSHKAAAWLRAHGLGHIDVQEPDDTDPLGFDDFDDDEDDYAAESKEATEVALFVRTGDVGESSTEEKERETEMVSLNISDLGTPTSSRDSPRGFGGIATAILSRLTTQRNASQVVAPIEDHEEPGNITVQ